MSTESVAQPETITCRVCGQEKPRGEFYRSRLRAHDFMCRHCDRIKAREKWQRRWVRMGGDRTERERRKAQARLAHEAIEALDFGPLPGRRGSREMRAEVARRAAIIRRLMPVSEPGDGARHYNEDAGRDLGPGEVKVYHCALDSRGGMCRGQG